MTPGFVSVRAVTKRYRERPAVDGVSLDIAEGRSVVLVGASGSGKTTLLRLIAGLERPDQGEVWLDGQLVSGAGQNIVPPYRRAIGFVFQDLALWPHMRVSAHLEFVLQSQGVRRGERAARCRDVLAMMRVDHLPHRYPHQLSGGEQQRVALARAIVARPRLLLLDEPLSSLDPELRTAMRDELIRLRTALGFTVLLVTHDRTDAAEVSDRIVEMRNGRI